MTFYSIVATDAATLASDRVVIPAGEVEALVGAVETARALAARRDAQAARLDAELERAREEGYRAGLAAGEREAATELAARLLVLEERSARERDVWRERATGNALDIVRRIAGTLGEPETLAALAREAAHELVPSATLVVQVHPDHVAAVRERLARRDAEHGPGVAALVVEAEESLAPDQCRLRNASGVAVLAGLETQLGSIERRALASAS